MPTRKLNPNRKTKVDPKSLTDRERIFIAEYLADPEMNATRAAKAAGYRQPSNQAGRLLSNPRVSAAISKAVNDRCTHKGLERDALLRHLEVALYLDPWEVFEKAPSGKGYMVKDLETIPLEIRRCITKLKYKVHEVWDRESEQVLDRSYFEIEFMSKEQMQVLAMKHGGLLTDRPLGEEGQVKPESIIQALEEAVETRGTRTVDVQMIEGPRR